MIWHPERPGKGWGQRGSQPLEAFKTRWNGETGGPLTGGLLWASAEGRGLAWHARIRTQAPRIYFTVCQKAFPNASGRREAGTLYPNQGRE